MSSFITVKDILERRHFEQIEVIAGKEGLGRIVKWVHVMEVTSIRNLLNGHELILSTGIAWGDQPKRLTAILDQLIDSHAAGLCIEMGTYMTDIPEEIIELANQHKFPIILFHQEVPFVEITQDIHSLLINRQYQLISELERYSQSLNKKLLTIEHHNEILKFIQQYLKVQVIIEFSNKAIHFIPEAVEAKRKVLLTLIENPDPKSQPAHSNYSLEKVPIHLLGGNYAYLIIASEERELTDYDALILDRTATALAQLLLRNLYAQEKRKAFEEEWITGWLNGQNSEESIKEHLSFLAPAIKPKGAHVCIYKLDSFDANADIDLTYFKLYFRAIFEQEGFFLLAIDKKHSLVFIMLNERSPSTWKKRMRAGLERMMNAESQWSSQNVKQTIGIGSFEENLTDINKSYRSALETIRIQTRLEGEQDRTKRYFYEDLHIFRLISLVNRHSDMHGMVLEYLSPVLQYDQKNNGKLMETLKTYLACNGSKQETAKRLFIVRQTLYHRLQKLETLLGNDFMHPEKRVAIEFMISAYDYLYAMDKEIKTDKEDVNGSPS